jgi:hypothetical protein
VARFGRCQYRCGLFGEGLGVCIILSRGFGLGFGWGGLLGPSDVVVVAVVEISLVVYFTLLGF